LSNATPSQCRWVADQPATQWKSAVSSRRGSVASSASSKEKDLATAPLISITGSIWTAGAGPVEVRTETREPIDEVLAGGGKCHAGAPSRDVDRVGARHCRPIWASIGGYTIRCRNGLIAAMYAAPSRPFGFT